MNIKDLILPLSLALLTTWGIQYFFLNNRQQQCDEYTFVASKRNPLSKEIDFLEEKRLTKVPVISEIETDWAILSFSTDGASLERLLFKHKVNGRLELIGTLYPHAQGDREERSLMVSFNTKTPYYYTLQERKDFADAVHLEYESISSIGTIHKTFIIYKHIHKIDLVIGINVASNQSLTPRVTFASPYVTQNESTDFISALVIYGKDTFEKISRDKLQGDRGWIEPSLFGLENRYFIHAMVQDMQGFTDRAYYTFAEKKNIIAVLEGQQINAPQEWTLSFYFGPKEATSMAAVDPRLERALDYSGLLAPLSKCMLWLLNWLYHYLHNYGLAIIALTFLIRLFLLPFTWHSERSMKQRLEVQKKLTYIQQRYKDNPEQLAQERAEIIRKHGMPGLGGCLPLLLQLPVFFALSRVLSNAIELHQAPMLWIPDLSAKDPYYVLPTLVCLAMLIQASYADAQQRTSMFVMAFVFGAITASFSSGLALYICVSTILGVLQTQLFKHF